MEMLWISFRDVGRGSCESYHSPIWILDQLNFCNIDCSSVNSSLILSCLHLTTLKFLPTVSYTLRSVVKMQGCHFNFFLGGRNFFKFFNATGLLKNWKKQHFICSNMMLFIVPFFLFSLFFSFFFSSFFFFFFSFSLGAMAPQPPSNNASVKMT